MSILQSYVTARPRNWGYESGHRVQRDGERQYMAIGDTMQEPSYVTFSDSIRIENHLCALLAYRRAFVGDGVVLRQFADPTCCSPDPHLNDYYHRMPSAFSMVWEKPE